MDLSPLSPRDEQIATFQLGRAVRGVAGVAWRCPCGCPGVLATYPRLPQGTPFPTTFYLTCPDAVHACSKLEVSGIMAQMTQRLRTDTDLAEAYRRAHESYLRDRAELGRQIGRRSGR